MAIDDFQPYIPPDGAPWLEPPPEPSSPDPFMHDPTIWPPPPPWLFPMVMTLLAIAVLVVLILIVGWFRSIQVAKAELEALPRKDWVDLSQLNIHGRWEDGSDRPLRRDKSRPDEPDEPDGPDAPDDP